MGEAFAGDAGWIRRSRNPADYTVPRLQAGYCLRVNTHLLPELSASLKR